MKKMGATAPEEYDSVWKLVMLTKGGEKEFVNRNEEFLD